MNNVGKGIEVLPQIILFQESTDFCSRIKKAYSRLQTETFKALHKMQRRRTFSIRYRYQG